MFLFEDASILKKLSIIEGRYVDPWTNLWGPLSCTLILLLVYPVLSVGAYYAWQFFTVTKRKIYIKVSGDVPLTLEESRVLRHELEEKDAEITKLTAYSSVKSKQLEKENSELVEVLNDKESQINEMQKQLSEFKSEKVALAKLESDYNKIRKDLSAREFELVDFETKRNKLEELIYSSDKEIQEYWDKEYFSRFMSDKKFNKSFGMVYDYFTGERDNVDSSDMEYAASLGLVESKDDIMHLTRKGKHIGKAMRQDIPF